MGKKISIKLKGDLMNMGIKDKRAIVMAASKGLGKAAAMALANEGCRVAICSRSKDSLTKTADEIRKNNNVDVILDLVDVENKNQIEGFVSKVEQNWGGVDILVTNAGGPPVKSFLETTDDEWQEWYQKTFMSVVRSIKAVVPAMQKAGWGRIINIASISVKAPVESLVYSNALRMAVIGLAKTLSLELGSSGINVHNVAPGYHFTDGLERIIKKKIELGQERDSVIDAWIQKIPVGRIGEPRDLANLITFLASDLSGYLTGTTIQCDGGMYSGTL
jgi:3-oxoacyl-[acyl-carrier protein] reductase